MRSFSHVNRGQLAEYEQQAPHALHGERSWDAAALIKLLISDRVVEDVRIRLLADRAAVSQ